MLYFAKCGRKDKQHNFGSPPASTATAKTPSHPISFPWRSLRYSSSQFEALEGRFICVAKCHGALAIRSSLAIAIEDGIK